MNAGNTYTPYDGKLAEEISSKVPVVGNYVTLRAGSFGTKQAKVLSNSASVQSYVDGKLMKLTNHIEVNQAVSSGDSGGGAIGGVSDVNRTNLVIGIIRAGDSISTFLVKGSNIINAFA